MNFPLGKPLDRKEWNPLTPIPGRPNWWQDHKGNERYIEPPPPKPIPVGEVTEIIELDENYVYFFDPKYWSGI
jgi:hypothetical protein